MMALVETVQGLGRADDLTAERVLAKDGLGQIVVDELRRGVLVERDLFEHDLALGLEVGHQGARHHVGHHGEGLVEVGVEEARVDQRVLLGGGRVQLAAHLVEDARDVPGRVVGRPLEDEVLDQMRDAGPGRVLVAGPDPYPEPESDRPYAVDGLGDDAQPIVERGDPEVRDGRPPL